MNGKLESPEALVVCLRHIVKHRGYDYHLTEDGKYPWGEELNDKGIIQWASHAYCSPQFKASLLNDIEFSADWAKKENGEPTDEFKAVEAALAKSVAEYENQPIEKMLERHLREKNHPNLREPARGSGNNFPRELVKKHLFQICENNSHHFPSGTYEKALRELLGERINDDNWKATCRNDTGVECQTIMDYHRRTPEEAEQLWLRKTKNCPFAENLHGIGKVKAAQIKCHDFRSDARVRRFNLLMFLAERKMEHANYQRELIPVEIVKTLLADLEQDIKATFVLLQKNRATECEIPERPDKPGKKSFEKRFNLKLAGVSEGSFNKSFFDQLADLIRPELRKLRDRAPLCGESAGALYELATKNQISFDPESVKQALRECGYYDWRKNQERGLGFYPQVEFLLGQRKHYTDDGLPQDVKGRKDGQPQHHGILRKLFAGQLRLDDGTPVNLTKEIGNKTVPDFVVVETIGDIPSHQLTPMEKEKKQKKQASNRAFKNELMKEYGLSDISNEKALKRAKVYNQQVILKKNLVTKKNEPVAICPYTGDEIGTFRKELEIEHIFPEKRGGISIVENLAITTRDINQAKDKSTPFEIAGKTIKGIKFLDWPSMKAQASKFEWSRPKYELFCREEESCPQWDNTTRMAQLARHLRTEIIHWLGLNKIPDEKERGRKITEKVGTPTGFQTSVCRESWAPPNVFPQMYRQLFDKKGVPVKDGNGRDRWIKDRSKLRHHLWDAAVLSHIPPGMGMNSVNYSGIFIEERDPVTGGFKTSAIANLGPDLNAFEKVNIERCLVSKPRQPKSKKPRYKEGIYGLKETDKTLSMREPLAKHAAKKKDNDLRKLFDRPGLLKPLEVKNEKTGVKKTIQLLREKDVEHWLECKDISLSQQEFREFLLGLEVPAERITDAAIAGEFVNKQTKEMRAKREFKAKQLIAFLRKKCGIPNTEISDMRVEAEVEVRQERATLRAANGNNGQPGQKILTLLMKQQRQQFYGLHLNPTAAKRNATQIAGYKAVDNSNCVIYLRKEIWIGQRLKTKGKKAVAEIYYESRLIPHPRHLAAYKKEKGVKWSSPPLPTGMIPAAKISVGDLLRIPLKQEKRNSKDNLIAKRGETPLETHFYRVKALLTGDKVEFQMAEYDQPKAPKGITPDPKTQRLLDIFELSSNTEKDLVWIVEFNTGKKIKPPAPLVDATSENQTVPPGSLL